MKKFFLIISIFLVAYVTFYFYKFTAKNSLNDVEQLAITLNGDIVNYFPEKGLYSVNVNCVNAVGKWLYDEWVLSVENISNESSCAIDFVSIEESNLNQHLISLSGIEQGNGKVILEKNAVTRNNNNFVTAEMIYESISGIPMIKNGNKYIGNDTVIGKESKSSFKIPKEGYIKMCYEVPPISATGNGDNILTIHKLNSDQSTLGYINSKNDGTINAGCYNFGHVNKNDIIYVKTRFVNSNISLSFEISDFSNEESTSYRFEGENPDNYISFNNELWRIIGVFDEYSHGENQENLVKIVKADSIGNYSFDHSRGISYEDSDLRILLNSYYYNSTDGTSSGHCYGDDEISLTCDFSSVGLKNDYRNMIENVKWYLGEIESDTVTSSNLFNIERQGSLNENKNITIDKIGLLYPSDIGYGVLEDDCDRKILLDNYSIYSEGNTNCLNNNWLYRQINTKSWLLGRFASIRDNWGTMYHTGGSSAIAWNGSDYGNPVHPTLYLKSNVQRIGGDGSILNPYIIAMDDETAS